MRAARRRDTRPRAGAQRRAVLGARAVAAASAVLVAALALALAAPAAHAQALGSAPPCIFAGPLPPEKPRIPLRFGTTGQAAGSVGGGQATVAPEDEARTLAALDGLEVPRRDLVLRLNRMFQSDGAAGIARFARLTDTYIARGFKVELQVRYHPAPEENGDIAAYVRFVRAAVREFAPRRDVIALSITNEPNLLASPNTSDGFYADNVQALVSGIVAAREEADRLGRPDLRLGFTYAYRFLYDEGFFDEIGRRSTPAFRRALDHVGLQAYPDLFYPPPGIVTAPEAMVGAATLMRTCLFPRAGIGEDVEIWVTENGYRSRRTDDPAVQSRLLTETIDALAAVSGTLGVTEYRYFNLRDNDSGGGDLFAAVGLLYDDYAPKPAYAAYRDAIARHGRDVPPSCAVRRLTLRPSLRRGERIRSVRVTVSGGRASRVRRVSDRRRVRVDVTRQRTGGMVRVVAHVRTTTGRRLRVVRRIAGCPA